MLRGYNIGGVNRGVKYGSVKESDTHANIRYVKLPKNQPNKPKQLFYDRKPTFFTK